MTSMPRPRDSPGPSEIRGAGSLTVLEPVVARALPDAAGRADFIDAVLAGARAFLGMDIAFVGEFADGFRIFRHVVDGPPGAADGGIRVGGCDPLESSYCQRIVDGRLPELIHDAQILPAAAELAATRQLAVGAHLSVPILLADGTVYGTFCTFAHTARDDLNVRDLAVMRMLASLIAGHLEIQRDLRRQAADDRARIRQIITDRAFRTVFQPIVDLRADVVVGYEALTRFRSGSPADWFAMAARTGTAVALEMATLVAAVDDLEQLPEGAYLAVNLSPAVLCSTEFEALTDVLPLARLVVEVTEQTAVDRPELPTRLQDLRARGARIAIDDAGAGHSGLQRILSVAPDIVKLDRDLISGIDRDPARQSLARALCWFTDRSGKLLIAEGIETVAERATLARLGIRFGQGYLLGRPGELPERNPAGLRAAERPA